jgi:hypothetical protein
MSRPAQAYLRNQLLADPIRAANPAGAALSDVPAVVGNALADAPPARVENVLAEKAAGPKEGDTATDDKTGERLVFRKGKWQRAKK